MPWQVWLYWHALERKPGGVGFRFQFLVVLVARQNGKTKWGRGLALWRLFYSKTGRVNGKQPGAKLAVIAAQTLDYAESTLKEAVDDIRDTPALCPELINHKETNGKHRAILTNRRYWRACTASTKGARSLTVDLVWLDELRTHTTWDAWDAITPTGTVRACSQVLVTTNAGAANAVVLRSLQAGSIRRIMSKTTDETKTGYFEWSVPPEVDPRNPKYWPMANPSLGYLNEFVIDDLHARLENMQYKNMPGWQTEYLCQSVDALEPGIIPAEFWQDGIDQTSRRAATSPIYAALDVNYQRTTSYVGIAARREDGNLHIEVAQAARGTDWVIDWLTERKDKFEGVAVQKTGAPASGMIADLKRAGVKVVEWSTGLDMQSGCATFYDGICEHEIYHRRSPLIDRAAASGVARRAGDAWIFDRRNSPIDIAPLVACCAAVWLEGRPASARSKVYEWPDEEQIKQWEEEAEREEAEREEQEKREQEKQHEAEVIPLER
jgi:phage terminase large subunit-like protein